MKIKKLINFGNKCPKCGSVNYTRKLGLYKCRNCKAKFKPLSTLQIMRGEM